MLEQRTVISGPEVLVLSDPTASGASGEPWGSDEKAEIRTDISPRLDRRPATEDALKVAIVDGISFTRECIDISIMNLSGQPPYAKILETEKFASCSEIFSSDIRFDIIVYHSHGPQGDSLAELRKL